MIPRHCALAALFVACAVAGCNSPKPARIERGNSDTEYIEDKPALRAIREASGLVVYEGLPHQYSEKEQLEEEKRQKKTIELHGFSFYASPLNISSEDVVALKGLLSDARSFRKWGGEKWCGGFHPDYLVEYRVGEATYRVLICFGCHEVKVFGPDCNLRYDIEGEAYKQLDLLKEYQVNRPTKRDS